MKLLLLTISSLLGLFKSNTNKDLNKTNYLVENLNIPGSKPGIATFGNCCFWCTEPIFQGQTGIVKITSGYSGGYVTEPTYKQVCACTTGHAGCLNIIYDPAKITFDELMEVFWQTHDPTTLNKQGNDICTQYRSVVFYHKQQQKDLAEKYKAELNKSGAWENSVVTSLELMKRFYAAEDYQQNYYNDNTG